MTQKDISNRIREQRKSVGMTQQMLADKVGVSMMTILRWENGTRTPNSSLMPRLADALGTSIEYLMGLHSEPQSQDKNLQEFLALNAPVSAGIAGNNIIIRDNNSHQEIEIPNDAEGHKLFLQLFSGLFSGFGGQSSSNSINGNYNSGNNLSISNN